MTKVVKLKESIMQIQQTIKHGEAGSKKLSTLFGDDYLGEWLIDVMEVGDKALSELESVASKVGLTGMTVKHDPEADIKDHSFAKKIDKGTEYTINFRGGYITGNYVRGVGISMGIGDPSQSAMLSYFG